MAQTYYHATRLSRNEPARERSGTGARRRPSCCADLHTENWTRLVV